jgi:hypothetical protein
MSASFVVYRGQKSWNKEMNVCAPTLRRRSCGGQDPVGWTDILLDIISALIQAAEQGDAIARRELEGRLLNSQQSSSDCPFVSCSYSWGVAQSFALFDDTPGYVLTITGDPSAGVDVEDLRKRHGLYSDALKYLREFGIPRQVEHPFAVSQVDQVKSFGQPSVRIYP